MVSGGCRRVSLLARGLRNLNVDVSILAPLLSPEEAISGLAVPHPQPEPEAVTIERRPTLKDWLRAQVMLPDPDIRWCRKAAHMAIEKWPAGFDCVLTTSPPESIHVGGLILKNKWGCGWVCDFRDHWFDYPLLKEREKRFRQRIEQQFAKRILNNADQISTVSASMASEFARFTTKPVNIVENFSDAAPAKDRNFFKSESDIHVVHTGAFTLSDGNRSLSDVLGAWESASRLNKKLRFHLVGPLSVEEQLLVKESILGDRVHYHGVVSREEARQFQTNADALVIHAASGTSVVPGKYAEYQSTGLPIIAIGNGDWRKEIDQDLSEIAALAQLEKTKSAQEIPHFRSVNVAAKEMLSLIQRSRV